MKLVEDEWVAHDNLAEWDCLVCGKTNIFEEDMDDHLLNVHNFEWYINREDTQLSVWIQKQRVLR